MKPLIWFECVTLVQSLVSFLAFVKLEILILISNFEKTEQL